MKIYILNSKENMGKAAAEKAAEILRKAIKEKGKANFIAATGVSQFEFLDHLTKITSLDWGETTMFHLDEYIGLSEDHPASFRRYLQERLISKVHPGKVFLIAGDAPDPEEECERLNDIISQYEIDVAFVGIGENGHLAFNDPPADFETEKPYIIVELDTACRRQQLGEGWFNCLEEVPQKAISMSVKQIMKAKNIICTVPDKRKAQAVKDCFGGEEISPYYPASILKRHDHCYVFLDEQSAMYLK
ncbi:MAG: glucosamine-6-phosphate deaminase [Candidatus Caldatribacteriota bacterium]